MGREPILMAAAGKKGVGKTWQHMVMLNQYVQGDPYRNVPGRKVLILDINDEYGVYGVPTISLENVALFTVHPTIEMRRIQPFFPDGRRFTLDEWCNALYHVLNRYQNGLLVIEDFNKFFGDHMPVDLIGSLATQRHVGLDILMSYQSFGRINTKIWGNLNVLRFHKNIESVEKHKDKFPDKYEMMRIAEIIIDHEYSNGNIRFFLYVDMDEQKIHGEFSDEVRDMAIDTFIYENYHKLVKPLLLQRSAGKKKYTEQQAKDAVHANIIRDYFTRK